MFCQFNHIVHLELFHEVSAVNVDRAWRNIQFGSDFRRTPAFSKQGSHLKFAPRQGARADLSRRGMLTDVYKRQVLERWWGVSSATLLGARFPVLELLRS